MKILVTGATGLVGKALCNSLIQKGYHIHYVTTSKNKIVTNKNYKGFYWNINSQEIDIQCFKGINAIIHLAGATIAKRWTTTYKKEIIESRILGSKLIFDTLSNINHTVKHFITASGIDIYPNSDTLAFDENSKEINQEFLGKVVQLWEKAASKFLELNIPVTYIRTGVVYDKNEGAFQKMMAPIKNGFGAIIGNGNQKLSWIHIEDLVPVYQTILEKPVYGVVNAVAPNCISNKDFTNNVARFYKKRILFPPIPKFVLRLLLGEMYQLLLSNKNVIPKVLEKNQFKFQYPFFGEVLKK